MKTFTFLFYFSSLIMGLGWFWALLPHASHYHEGMHMIMLYSEQQILSHVLTGVAIALLGLAGMLLTAKKA